ncbi:MAG: hypothetical protein FD131_283 [Rhodocyclaceae bacterium]|nr:MAG: hypothetical protein FD131_283 [Rhodocyclaceae bacterium]
MPGGGKIKNTNLNFDPEFRFLLELDPGFEAWRMLAAEWFAISTKEGRFPKAIREGLCPFLVSYLHGQNLDLRPVALFERDAQLPDLRTVLKLDESVGNYRIHDIIVDFLNWVLEAHLTEKDADGSTVVPECLNQPIQRLARKRINKRADVGFKHIVLRDPKMVNWQELAAEWLALQKLNLDKRLYGLNKFLIDYIIGRNLPRNPITFLMRTSEKPSFVDVLIASKSKGKKGKLTAGQLAVNNVVSVFLDWVLAEKIARIADENGLRYIPPEFHNPIEFMRKSDARIENYSESVRTALSIRYIKELRGMLSEGPNFRDWKWAHVVMDEGYTGGDWFMVDPMLVDRDDPDCVWRERNSTRDERRYRGLPARITELWSPARAVALYIKLELPLRTFQVRMLDSGECDTWRYQDGKFVLNDSPLAMGNPRSPRQYGVFHHSQNESGAGLYINTNKTADINKPESKKGYVIPWQHDTVLYWLEKLRNWQERYNRLLEPVAWSELEEKHFGRAIPHFDVLEARGVASFLFRDAAAKGGDRFKPIPDASMDRVWYRLLRRLEQRCHDRGETANNGMPIQFVVPNSPTTTFYPLHALRVSLISYLILDAQLPLPIVSKLIAGHARIIMTLYYTKMGVSYVRDVMEAADRRAIEAEQANHARFLNEATFEEISRRFASISDDAIRYAKLQKSAAAFIFEDKGICPVAGSMCDVGGEIIRDWAKHAVYSPVIGYPNQRNCVCCRFFLTGPAYLAGLQAHFNAMSFEAHESAKRWTGANDHLIKLENTQLTSKLNGTPFTQFEELNKASHRVSVELETFGVLHNVMQATHYLIGRSLDLCKAGQKEGVRLVAAGGIDDITFAFTETASESHQLAVVCQNSTIYPEIDASKAALRQSQLVDIMLTINGKPPVLYKLTPEQQMEVGNQIMKMIEVRTGSIAGAVEFVEGRRLLNEIGMLDDAMDLVSPYINSVEAKTIIETAQAKRVLAAVTENDGENDAS